MLTLKQLNKIIDIIIDKAKPQKIILFGSYANNTANEDSDLDLLIVKYSNLQRIKRAKEIRKYLTNFLIPKDILVYTEEEIKEWENVNSAFITSIIREGKVCYEKSE